MSQKHEKKSSKVVPIMGSLIYGDFNAWGNCEFGVVFRFLAKKSCQKITKKVTTP